MQGIGPADRVICLSSVRESRLSPLGLVVGVGLLFANYWSCRMGWRVNYGIHCIGMDPQLVIAYFGSITVVRVEFYYSG